MRIHLITDRADVPGMFYLWCGYQQNFNLTYDPNKATCLTCLKAYQAWQKRQEGK